MTDHIRQVTERLLAKTEAKRAALIGMVERGGDQMEQRLYELWDTEQNIKAHKAALGA